MIRCRVCSRDFHEGEEPQPYLKLSPRSERPAFASYVCLWCWGDFAHGTVDQSENAFNLWASLQMLTLAKRAAQGKTLVRCEAICWDTNQDGRLPSHRCGHYARSPSADGPRLCGIHQVHSKRRQILTVPPSRPRFFIAAETPDEFIAEASRLIPAEWISRVFGAYAKEGAQ